jgi:hypothetical protein
MLMLDTSLNVKAATTQFIGIDADSMVKFGDGFLIANDSGLFSYKGQQDDGVVVSAFFELNSMDLGTHRKKRIRFFYIGLETTGPLKMTVSTEEGQTAVIDIPFKQVGQTEVRVSSPRSVYGTYWTIQIGNGDSGSDFSIDYIKALPIVR